MVAAVILRTRYTGRKTKDIGAKVAQAGIHDDGGDSRAVAEALGDP